MENLPFNISQIKTGDCMLVSSTTTLPKLIQYFQKLKNKEAGQYNHAAMFWWCYDELMVIEAERGGITVTPFVKEYMNKNVYKKIIGLRPNFSVDGSEYGKFMLPYAGKTKYDFTDLLLFQMVRFMSSDKIWIGPKHTSEKMFICGEWCAHVYNHFRPNTFLKEYKIAPMDLFISPDFTHYNIKG